MRILLVEDDISVASFITKGLQEEQYAIDGTADGEEGFLMASAIPYDLLILDVMVPKMNGFAICRRLREKGLATPILLLTARDAVDDRVAGLDTGADDYLTKPFAFPELLARIRALIRRGSAQSTTHLTAANLELDPVSHRVWRAGNDITLTGKEYALLEYLMRNVNRVLTRTAIIDHVWDIHYNSMTNIVDVQIRSLRSKIDRGYSPQLIHTIRGVGYILKTGED